MQSILLIPLKGNTMPHRSFILPGICLATVICTAILCRAQEANPALEDLRKAAKAEIATEAPEKQKDEAFTSGALGLQKLNPEISDR